MKKIFYFLALFFLIPSYLFADNYAVSFITGLALGIGFAIPFSIWVEKERQAKILAFDKLRQEEDICDVCGKKGKSEKMYRVIKFGEPYYEGEFVRVHPDCYNPMQYNILWKPSMENINFGRYNDKFIGGLFII